MAGNGADGPAFGAVVAQNLRFSFRGEGHACSCEVGDGESDGAESLGAPTQVTSDGNDSNARAPKSPVPSVLSEVEQERRVRWNPDASLLAVLLGSGAGVRRGRDGLAEWTDSGNQRHAQRCIVPDPHRRQCRSGGHDHSGCK